MGALTWLRGLVAHRGARLGATAVGVAIAVALLASIGAFLSATTSRMTDRAASQVPVDWQVEVQPGADGRAVVDQTSAFPGVRHASVVRFAPTTGLVSRTDGSVQTTGPGRVVGVPAGYSEAFPGEIRLLGGRADGVLLAQQTAANLRARPGDVVEVGRPGLAAARVRIDGIVDLPAADSLFQRVGAPVGAQPQAPPDNVLLLPAATFSRVEGPLVRSRPELVRTQIHLNLTRSLSPSPAAAYRQVTGQARNLETRLAGGGLVGDNLGTALGAARQDAVYAQVLFLLLGLPGAVIAGMLTATVASAGADRRRRDQALLRARGASSRQLAGLSLAETALAGSLGVLAGLGAALVIGQRAFGAAGFGAGPVAAAAWGSGAALAGLLIAGASIALPAIRDARASTVAAQRRRLRRPGRSPLWARLGLDVLALAGAGLVYWQATRSGYSLVLAPEGVPQVSVSWYALLGPILGWLGIGLLTYRLVHLGLGRGRALLARTLRPFAGPLAPTLSATMARGRSRLALVVALLALTAAFAGSTAIFNSTYQQQVEVDARLTNGADVTVTTSPGAEVGPGEAASIRSVPGVAGVEPLQHRFAYVGSDLQDLYGVRPATIGSAGKLQDAWFAGGTAGGLMQTLAARPDGVLVSAETVRDFQLAPGDLLRLRLQDVRTKRVRTVPFHYVGVAKEFPTAPSDSFLVANASYVARATGSDAVGAFLVQTDGTAPPTVAGRVRDRLGPSAQVSDVVSQRRVVGSSLTAVELSGLTRVELGFALVLAAAATAIVMGLGFRDRRRTFAVLSALGARGRRLGGMIWAETGLVLALGLGLGAGAATGVSLLLVKVLTGVFDPPPAALAIPWPYLLGVTALAGVGAASAAALALRALRRSGIEDLREP